MNGSMRFATDGTAALAPLTGSNRRGSKVVEVVAIRCGGSRKASRGAHAAPAKAPADKVKAFFRNALDSSEMYCSLKFEDFRGCPYGIFTQRGIAVLSAASSCIAVLSIAFGC